VLEDEDGGVTDGGVDVADGGGGDDDDGAGRATEAGDGESQNGKLNASKRLVVTPNEPASAGYKNADISSRALGFACSRFVNWFNPAIRLRACAC
jgi:hypothetical protein